MACFLCEKAAVSYACYPKKTPQTDGKECGIIEAAHGHGAERAVGYVKVMVLFQFYFIFLPMLDFSAGMVYHIGMEKNRIGRGEKKYASKTVEAFGITKATVYPGYRYSKTN